MPAIWLIDAYRAGERGQVRALAQTLAELPGWSLEVLQLEYRQAVVWPHVLGAASLAGIRSHAAKQMAPPWPDLVITCGVRNEPVCRWLQRQSGGRTRYVHVGRPWGPLDSFDLVVTTPQYRVPDRPNVLNNVLTLHRVDAVRLARAAQRFAPRFSDLSPPYITVNVGGNSGPYTLGPRAGARLGREVSRLAEERGASLLVSTSARTPVEATDALAAALRVPHRLYRWQADDPDNPYLGMLALADEIVVSADSIAMLSEACATGKPVYMFDLGGMRPDVAVDRDARTGASLYAFLMRYCWQRLSRDISLVHTALQEAGLAAWLGDPPAPGQGRSDLDAAVASVLALVGETGAPFDVQ